jgi:hypothetical protein
MSTSNDGGSGTGNLARRDLEEWNLAYVRVEAYLRALRVRNRILLGQLVTQVLERTMNRALAEPERPPTDLAAEEMDRVITGWYGQVLEESPLGAAHRLSTKGRLALLLADMPGKWQDQFLRPGPWPEEFVRTMRQAYLRAGPDFQLSRMAPRPLDLGPIVRLTQFSRWSYAKTTAAVVWIAFALLLVLIFIRTH